MKNVISTSLGIILTAALLCAAGLLVSCAHAQPSDTDTGQLTQLRAKAEKGEAQAQCDLGQVYYDGKYGEATNYVDAVKWYRKAAEQDHVQAQNNLGICYLYGRGVPKDEATAVQWFLRAAEKNLAMAQFNLGTCYDEGLGVAKDGVEAVKWYRKAAGQNLALAQCNLGRCYANGLGVAKDEVEAGKWYRKAADQGDAEAQYNLGNCYLLGRGVPKDEVEAVKWYRKAAGQNFALAQLNLGVCYYQGQGVAKDAVEAVKWISKAAEQNLGDAQFKLGICYLQGHQGVAKDEVEAYKWWLPAAAQGDELAKQNVSKLEPQLTPEQRADGQKRASEFKPTEITSPDDQQGEVDSNLPTDLLAKAEAGDAKAQNELGEALYFGRQGATMNPTEAVKWFRRAAEQNFAAAQSNLGHCYEIGDGVAKYEVEAYKWYLLAAAQGDPKAKNSVTLLELMLSPEQITEGKRRAQDWREQLKAASSSHASGM